MPNILDATGLTTSTRDELVAYFTAKYQTIYGTDINLESNSPDGQMMNIFVQAILDMQDLLAQIYNSFDPDNAVGVVLDQRVTINGIERQGGTYTITPVSISVTQSINLYGLDQTDQEIYTVADNAGNRWLLETTQLGVTPGTYSYNFRAATPGANFTIPNTITTQITIVLGVSAVNNPTTYTTLGVNQETDAQLRLRRQKSVSLSSQGYLAGLLAALENVNGVTSAFVYENNTNTTNVDGVPGHSIWVIVAGSGAVADIADAIYTKRNAGCGMFGDVSYVITQVDGTTFTVYWDDVAAQTVFIEFTVTSIDGVTAPNIAAIRAGLVESLVPGVYDTININELSTAVQAIDANTLVTNAGFSDGQTQTLNLSGVPASGTFKLSYNGNETAVINWNDSTPTIEGKLQAVTGLSTATVSGSLAAQSLVVDLSTIDSVQALIYATSNSLQTSGPVAITFTYDEDISNILTPASKKNQFVVAEANIVILPMQFSPSTASVVALGTQQFEGLGGYGAYTYTITVNNSGGSIDASTGLYTAGSTPTVVDTIKVVDKQGNSATANVSVTA